MESSPRSHFKDVAISCINCGAVKLKKKKKKRLNPDVQGAGRAVADTSAGSAQGWWLEDEVPGRNTHSATVPAMARGGPWQASPRRRYCHLVVMQLLAEAAPWLSGPQALGAKRRQCQACSGPPRSIDRHLAGKWPSLCAGLSPGRGTSDPPLLRV